MRVEYTPDGMLQVNLEDVLSLLNAEQRIALVDALACNDDVIKCVVDQIFDGWTERGSHAAVSHHANAAPSTGLDYATRQVALRAGEVAKKEIARLQEALKTVDEEFQVYRAERRAERRSAYERA